jgi:hypothetical protein
VDENELRDDGLSKTREKTRAVGAWKSIVEHGV